MFDSHTRLLEIKSAIDNHEVYRTSILLMDFLKDYLDESSLLEDAVRLRKKYNNLRELGTSDIPAVKADEILKEARHILEGIPVHTLADKDAELLQAYPQLPLIEAGEIEKQYARGRFKLGPVSTLIQPGKITGIVGENGNGKTTLLRILARLLDYDKGDLKYHLDGKDISDNYLIKHKIAYIPQKLERWNGTLRENLHFAAAAHGIKGKWNDRNVEFVLARMGLSKFADLSWSELSSGYKLRFELAKMLVWSPRVLILDEPLANLDINAQQGMLNDFRHIAGSLKNPVGIVLSSQQLFEVEHVADSIIFLSNGQCRYSGKIKDFMADREVNIFEVSGDFTVADLKLKFFASQYIFSENGSSVTVKTHRSVTSTDVLREFLNEGFTLQYFRDISTSTKQLFKL